MDIQYFKNLLFVIICKRPAILEIPGLWVMTAFTVMYTPRHPNGDSASQPVVHIWVCNINNIHKLKLFNMFNSVFNLFLLSVVE